MSGSARRAASRSRRLARFRATAFPTFLEQVKPTRVIALPSPRSRPCRRSPGVEALAALAAARKSRRCRITGSAGRLGAEGFPSAGTATVQDLAAVLSGHARTKAVAAFAHQVRGLKSTFHLTSLRADRSVVAMGRSSEVLSGHSIRQTALSSVRVQGCQFAQPLFQVNGFLCSA